MRHEIEKSIRANGLRSYHAAQSALEIPPKSDPAKWRLEKRWIAQSASPLSKDGPIRSTFERFPFAREPLEQTVSPEVQISVWQFASGLGKTEQFLDVLGYCVEYQPCNIFCAWPKDDTRDYNSENLVKRSLIEATPSLQRLFYEAKSRDESNTKAFKRFAGGSLLMRGAQVASNFRGPRCGCAYGGEVDGMNETTEGDPIELLWKRCEGFDEAIKILEGTPTIKGKSRIEGYLLQSDYRKWFVPCRSCGVRQVWMWKNVDWPKAGRSRHEHAVLLCGTCAKAHDDRQRIRSILEGRWQPTQEFNGIRGYWLNGINTLLDPEKGFKSKLHQFAADASRAAHASNKSHTVRVWTNTFLAETFQEEQDQKQDSKSIYNRREEYPKAGLPKGIIQLTAGADVQEDRIECEIIGWGRDEESWGVRTAVFFGDPKMPDIWARLDAFLSTIFIREDRAPLRIKAAGIDTGYAASLRMAYGWIRPRQPRNINALKGANSIEAELVKRAAKSKVDRVTLLMVGTHRIKGFIYDRALLTLPEGHIGGFPGYMHFPKAETPEQNYNEEFFRQLLSENSYTEYKNGEKLRRFIHEKKPDGTMDRNEKLDCRVYAYAALLARGPVNWDVEEKRLLASIPPEDGKPAPQKKTRARGGNYFSW
jgi:phage terminase large subunit GpA-like protein